MGDLLKKKKKKKKNFNFGRGKIVPQAQSDLQQKNRNLQNKTKISGGSGYL